MPSKLSAKLSRDVGILVKLVAMLSDWQTAVCKVFKAKPDHIVKHSSEKNATYVANAAESKDFKGHGRIFWVHSFYAPLVLPVRDKDGEFVSTTRPSLKDAWETLQKSGDVSTDFRAVTDTAYEQGLLKRAWNKGTLSYAVSADLPEREAKGTVKRSKMSSADILRDIRKR